MTPTVARGYQNVRDDYGRTASTHAHERVATPRLSVVSASVGSWNEGGPRPALGTPLGRGLTRSHLIDVTDRSTSAMAHAICPFAPRPWIPGGAA